METVPIPSPQRLRTLLGVAALCGGVALAIAAVGGRLADDFPPVLGLFVAATIVLVGMWALRVERLLGRASPPMDWGTFWAGSLAMAVGCLLMAVSVADPRDEAFHAPRWIVTAVGAVFLLAGVAVMRKAVYGTEAERKGDLAGC